MSDVQFFTPFQRRLLRWWVQITVVAYIVVGLVFLLAWQQWRVK